MLLVRQEALAILLRNIDISFNRIKHTLNKELIISVIKYTLAESYSLRNNQPTEAVSDNH